MTKTDAILKSTSASSTRMLVAMVGIGLLCALLIVLTYEGTLDRIALNKANALDAAVFNVLPDVETKQAFVLTQDKAFTVSNTSTPDAQVIYAGYDSNENLTGIAIEASGMGYADIIRILYGYDPHSQTIIGFQVLESKETPGLGDKIEKDAIFLQNFEALDVALNTNQSALSNTVVAVKSGTKTDSWQIDGITGATISSRAIADIIADNGNRILPVIQSQLQFLESGNTNK